MYDSPTPSECNEAYLRGKSDAVFREYNNPYSDETLWGYCDKGYWDMYNMRAHLS